MALQCRTEQPADFSQVEKLIEAAFASETLSDQSEHLLVARLRRSSAFIPELSIVAVEDGKLVGHILLTKAHIESEGGRVETLALAPVSVHPDHQGQGIGSELIEEAHARATDLGFTSVVLLGHAAYYPRFGYVPSVRYNIRFPFAVPEENCMVKELQAGALAEISGLVVYAPEFQMEH